jgi:uroporphyrinogen-III synthase
MKFALIFRPLRDALPLAGELKSKGVEPYLCPLYHPCFLPLLPLENPQALIVTSKNALRALESHDDLKKLPLYAVGDETAALAQGMGFPEVISASGTSQELIQCILKRAHSKAGILWHLSGQIVKGNIVETLIEKRFEAQRRIVYSVEEAKNLPDPLLSHLQNQKIAYVLFFSSHTALLFVNLLKIYGLEKSACKMRAICLSQAIALKASMLTWKEIWISPKPTAQSMMSYFNEKR